MKVTTRTTRPSTELSSMISPHAGASSTAPIPARTAIASTRPDRASTSPPSVSASAAKTDRGAVTTCGTRRHHALLAASPARARSAPSRSARATGLTGGWSLIPRGYVSRGRLARLLPAPLTSSTRPRSCRARRAGRCRGGLRPAGPGGRPGGRLLHLPHVLRRADGDHLAARLAALGPEVDDPVGLLDHVEVVLDHEHGVPGVDEALQHLEQLLDVGEMEPGGRLVE